MRAGAVREIGRGLDRQRLGDRPDGLSPSRRACPRAWCGCSSSRAAVDQRAGLAVHAGDRIRPERGDLPKSFEQEIVGHRRHDAGHARHVELERADAELARRRPGSSASCCRREDLRMEHRVDIAALVHGAAERRHVVEIGVVERCAGRCRSWSRRRARPRAFPSPPPPRTIARCRYGCADRKCRAARPCRAHRASARPSRQILAEGRDPAAGDATSASPSDAGMTSVPSRTTGRACASWPLSSADRSGVVSRGCTDALRPVTARIPSPGSVAIARRRRA